jgi:ZIP family zinc transporter
MDAMEAFVVGALAQSSLLVSGVAVYFFTLPDRVVGQIAGFGAGALLGAAVFELIPEANLLSNWEIGIWMLVGGSVYVVADRAIDRRSGRSSGAMGIVVGNVNDALPESVIFGIQLGSGLALSAGFVGAVWVSNIPQALPPSADLAASGWSAKRMSMMWGIVVVLSGVFAVVGYVLTTTFTGVAGDRIAAFTVGGLITMITTSLIPFAYDKGGLPAGLWAVVGLAASLATT